MAENIDETEAIEEQKHSIEELKAFCKNEGEYKDLTTKISLAGIIMSQVNEVFTDSLYNPDSGEELINSANKTVDRLREIFIQTYIKSSIEMEELQPIPEIEDICEWVTQAHEGISQSLYSDDFVLTVINPALETLKNGIIEFSKEEQAELDQTGEAEEPLIES